MRVLTADRRPKVRFALWALLHEHAEAEVVGEATGRADLVAQVRRCRPDVLLVDWGLCGEDPGTLLEAIRSICPDVRVVALSGRPEAGPIALASGVDAFVSKGDPPESLIAAIGFA